MSSPTFPRTGCASVRVSWDGDGAFTGPYDDVTRDALADPGITIDLGRDGARALSPPKVSAADFILRNDTGRYSQEHGGSPVYQRVLPGRPCRVEYTHGADIAYDAHVAYDAPIYYDGVATRTLARTAIDDIAQDTTLGQQTVTLRTLGIETLLVGTTVTVGLMTLPLVSECVTAILDAVGWPSSQRAISISDTRLLWWWCDDRQPWAALLELLASEGPGSLYVTAENGGTLHFENRNYRTTAARSVTPQASFYDRRGAGAVAYDDPITYDSSYAYDGEREVLYFTALSYDPGFRNIYNAARYPTNRRVLGTLAPIWQYGASLQPSAPGTTLIVPPSDPFQNAVVPVAGTDYTVSGGTVSMALSATSGLTAFLTVTATSGAPIVAGPTASPATGLQLRAQPLTPIGQTSVAHTIDTSASILRYSPIPGVPIPRVLDIAGWPEIDAPAAQAVCDAWVSRYQVQRPAVTIELRNVDGSHLAQILARTVSDRLSLLERNTGLAADVWVNSKAVTISGAGGVDVRCTLGCEKIDEAHGAIWDGPNVPQNWWDTAIWGT